MEFITTAVHFVKEIITGNYITAGLVVAPFILPNALVRKVGYGVGVACSKVLRQKAGKKSGEEVEAYFQGSINALLGGLNDGMDVDDKAE